MVMQALRVTNLDQQVNNSDRFKLIYFVALSHGIKACCNFLTHTWKCNMYLEDLRIIFMTGVSHMSMLSVHD